MKGLWLKSIAEVRLLLACLAVLLFAFNWLFIYLSNLVKIGAFGVFLQSLPPAFEDLAGVPFATVATPLGRIAMVYVHPVVIFSGVAWSIARGSDVVSGEIGRGMMEMLLGQPVRRLAVLLVPAVVTTVGTALLVAMCWLGNAAGIANTRLQ